MSFSLPIQSIPISIYSHKATFAAERFQNVAISYYKLSIKKVGATVWDDYLFSPEVEYAYVERLDPASFYISKWSVSGIPVGGIDEEVHQSAEYTFRTRNIERFFIRSAIPYPLSGSDFTSALQEELDVSIEYVNIKDEEDAVERLLKEGTGKIPDPESDNGGLNLTKNSFGNKLFLSNGKFQSGSGLEDTSQEWYDGARVWKINKPGGFLEINAESMPNLIVNGVFYGYMGSYLDLSGMSQYKIMWSIFEILPRPLNTWCIGKITILGGVVTEIDNTKQDVIETMQSLKGRLLDGLTPPNNNSGGNSLRLSYENTTPISLNYPTINQWLNVTDSFSFIVDGQNSLNQISISMAGKFNSVTNSNVKLKVIIDNGTIFSGEYIISLSPNNDNPNSGSGTLTVPSLSRGNHTLTVQVLSSSTGTLEIENKHLRIQVVELGSGLGLTGSVNSRNILFDPRSAVPRTVYSAIKSLEKDLKEYIDNKVADLDPTQNIQLEHVLKQLSRGIISIGDIYPESLLRQEGAYLIPKKYGLRDTFLDLDNDGFKETQSPVFEGEGTIEEDPETGLWIV